MYITKLKNYTYTLYNTLNNYLLIPLIFSIHLKVKTNTPTNLIHKPNLFKKTLKIKQTTKKQKKITKIFPKLQQRVQ